MPLPSRPLKSLAGLFDCQSNEDSAPPLHPRRRRPRRPRHCTPPRPCSSLARLHALTSPPRALPALRFRRTIAPAPCELLCPPLPLPAAPNLVPNGALTPPLGLEGAQLPRLPAVVVLSRVVCAGASEAGVYL